MAVGMHAKRKLGVTSHFSQIIELKFGQKMSHIVMHFRAFSSNSCSIISEKYVVTGYPQFSFLIPVTLANI